MKVWDNPFKVRRAPLIVDLLADPFERAEVEGMDYDHWFGEHMFLMVPAQVKVKQFVETFKTFPPRQKGASFGVDQVLASLTPTNK